MKTRAIIYSMLVLLVLSCGGMNDNIQEYLDRGEINYLGRADSAKAIGGKGRILFIWQPGKDSRIEECLISWNEKQDSVIVPVDIDEIDENGYFNVVVDGFEEGTYIFNMHHLSKKGYPSIKYEVVGRVYGARYQETLSPRRIKEIIVREDKIVLNWGIPTDSCRVVLSYSDLSGNMQLRNISTEEDSTFIENYRPGSEFAYKTYYLPEPGALDEFWVDSEILYFPLK